MEELCRSIGHQNAAMLTGRSAGSAQFPAPVANSCQHLCAQRAKPQEDTRKTQDIAGNDEKSVKANDYKAKNNLRNHESVDGSFTDDGEMSVRTKGCEGHATGRKHESVGGSFADELNAYIPKESVLMRSIRNRTSEGLFFSERYPVGCKIDSLEDVLLQDLLADSNSSTGGALIIQDINQDWAETLHSEFPKSAHTTFFAEHMVRLDGESITDASMRQLGKEIGNICPDARMGVKHFGDKCLALDFGFPFQLPKHNGFHVDFLFQTIGLERVPTKYSFLGGTRQTIYEKDASNHWRRASHRISWCQLAEQFYLVLIESSPGFEQELSSTSMVERPYQILLDPRIDACEFRTQPRLVIEYAGWEGPNNSLRSMIAELLQYHTVESVFSPVAVPINETLGGLRSLRDGVEMPFVLKAADAADCPYEITTTRGNRQMVVWLLTESSWQIAISILEGKWQRVRCRATKMAGDESFMMLTGLRRQVADAQNLIAESKEAFTRTIKETGLWVVNGRIITADEFWSSRAEAPSTAIFRHAQSMDIRNLPDSFDKMEEKLSAMTRAINQEIQVVIGSVQVEDAKTMKRQTEWMVALALLAAIYLPMTLVTGIFGMNISEINADKTLPSRWAALKAWGVVFGATVGCLLIYGMARRLIRWILEQREMAKTEAMHVEALKEN